MKKILFLLSTLFFVLIFAEGCGPSRMVVRERPAPAVYVRPVAPSPAYIWVDGNWIRHGRGYGYQHGYWVAPQPHHRYYVPGHWQKRRRGWSWARGHW